MKLDKGLQRLATEIKILSSTNRSVEIWWRDDDLETPSQQLDNLISTAHNIKLAPMLAVIPARASKQLEGVLNKCDIKIAIHGFKHHNHEPVKNKKAEFGSVRTIETQKIDLENAIKQLEQIFGGLFLKCLVPPWNRINDALPHLLPSLGISGLSTFASRKRIPSIPGLTQINTHIDVIDWKRTRKFIGAELMAQELAAQLKNSRAGITDGQEPIGLLSHHLLMSAADWQEFQEVCLFLKESSNIKLTAPQNYFG